MEEAGVRRPEDQAAVHRVRRPGCTRPAPIATRRRDALVRHAKPRVNRLESQRTQASYGPSCRIGYMFVNFSWVTNEHTGLVAQCN